MKQLYSAGGLHRACRRAFELAFSTTYMFAGSRPQFLLVDEVTFQHPVSNSQLGLKWIYWKLPF